jgi:hypothetical protein
MALQTLPLTNLHDTLKLKPNAETSFSLLESGKMEVGDTGDLQVLEDCCPFTTQTCGQGMLSTSKKSHNASKSTINNGRNGCLLLMRKGTHRQKTVFYAEARQLL